MSELRPLVTNPAHSPGLAALAFSRDGVYAYTGGTDSLVRIWRTEEGSEQEPEFAQDPSEPITALAVADNCWLSGCVDSEVRRYAPGKAELEGLVTSTNGVPIRGLAVDPTGKRIAVVSDEVGVRLIELQNTINIEILSGHTKGVRRATWHPSSTLLTTCGMDGKVIVWDVSEELSRIEHTIEGVIPAVSDVESPDLMHDCSAVWHPSGNHFYVATRSHEIVAISRPNWSRISTFFDDSITGAVTALALSPNGVYLASASNSGIAIWSTSNRRLLFRRPPTPDVAILQLAWSPVSNLLAWVDSDGVFSRWEKPIPVSHPDPVKPPNSSAVIGHQVQRSAALDLFGDDVNVNSGDKVKANKDNEPHAADDNVGGDLGVDDDWIIDDIGGGVLEDQEATGDGKDEFVREMVSITKAQPAFQPNATPLEHKKRYLAYNMIGVIEATDQDLHQIINVEFHDKSLHKGYHFNDNFRYNLAYLGHRGAIFACEPQDSEHPAQVYFKPYNSWSGSTEWTYTLRENTRVLGVAAGGQAMTSSSSFSPLDGGQGCVVIATSEGDLTFLMGSEGERRIVPLDGDFIAMVASAEWVFVVYRPGSTSMDGSQNLMGVMINFDDLTVMQRCPVPIPKKHTLKWLGITEEGAPVIYDSTGYLSVLTKHRAPMRASWARVLDTNLLERRKGKDESYWPVGVSAEKFYCLILKGRQEHPGFPRPLIQELPMRMPFRTEVSKETDLEEHIQRENIFLNIERDHLTDDELTTDAISARENKLDKEILLLIQAACKSDKLARAFDLTTLLHHTENINKAIKIAGFYHLVGLQEKMEVLKESREDEDGEGGGDRAERERRKRIEYRRESNILEPGYHASSSSSSAFVARVEQRSRGFNDFGPPPRIDRPEHRPAVPVVEHTQFSYKSGGSLPRSSTSRLTPPGSLTPPEGEEIGSSSLDGKRKRDDVEEDSGHHSSWGKDGGLKRRAVEESEFLPPPAPAKPKANPFARKPDQEKERNPFATRRAAENNSSSNNRTIQKSESFFDKVDAAESVGKSSKRPTTTTTKSKNKESGKQTTLFGLIPGASSSTTDKKGKKKGANASVNDDDSADADDRTEETQSTDVAMTDATGLIEGTQYSTATEETQETEPAGVESQQSYAAEEEPIEWEATPPPE